MKLGSLLLHILIFLTTAFCALVADAQDYPHEMQKYGFIQYEKNRLIFPGDSAKFENMFKRFDRLFFQGQGQLNVAQVGGSHVQADIWTDQMRQRLQTIAPGCRGGRGFLFPYKMARTNSPFFLHTAFTGSWEPCRNVEYRRVCELGIAGMSVTTYDTLSSLKMYFSAPGYPAYEYNRLKVFHDVGAGRFAVMPEHAQHITAQRTDSLRNFTEFTFDRYSDTVSLSFRKTDSAQHSFALYGLSMETQDPGFFYHAIGVNGASVPSYLRCHLFAPQLSALSPDLIIFSVGINDASTTDFSAAAYERNYDSLITRILAWSPDVCLLFTTNTDSYYKKKYPNKNAEAVRGVMLRLAQKYNGAVWDLYGVMGGLGSIKLWQKEQLAQSDYIHLTPEGYRILGNLFFSALLRSYENHLKHSPVKP